MKKIKKDALRGENLFNNLILGSLFVLEFPAMFLVNYTFDHLINGLLCFAGMFAWFFFLFILKMLQENRILKKPTRRFIKGFDDHGDSISNPYRFILRGKPYILDDANQYIRKQVDLAELENLKNEVRAYNLAQKTNLASYPFEEPKPFLSVEQIENLQYYAGLELGDKKYITHKAEGQFIQDAVMEEWYLEKTKQQPLRQDPFTKKMIPTDEFKEWREKMTDIEALLDQRIQKQLKRLPTQEEKIKAYKYNRIAETIAQQFSQYQIKCAMDNKVDGRSLHAWLQHYENYEELLKEHYILEKALELSELNNLPSTNQIFETYKLKEMIRTVIPIEPAHFKHKPEREFENIIIYARTPFETAVLWRDMREKYKGYSNIPMLGAIANINIFAWADPHLPLMVLAHSPGKGYTCQQMILEIEDIEEAKKDVQLIEINKLLKENIILESDVKKAVAVGDAYRKVSSDRTNEMESLIQRSSQQEIAKIKQEYKEREKAVNLPTRKLGKKAKRIIFILSIIGSIALIIVFLFIFFSPAPTPEPTLLSSLFSS